MFRQVPPSSRFISRQLPSSTSRPFSTVTSPISKASTSAFRINHRSWNRARGSTGVSPCPAFSSAFFGPRAVPTQRTFATETNEEVEVERATDEVDVLIVGAGPAGLALSIRLKQLDPNLRVVQLEKASEVGAHILSGAVIETDPLTELCPEWKDEEKEMLGEEDGEESGEAAGHVYGCEVTKDEMRYLTKGGGAWKIPEPPQMKNAGTSNRIVSLSRLVRHLGEKAEAAEVEIYPGFGGKSILFTEDGKGVKGVVTNDVGIGKDGKKKDGVWEPGMEFRAKVTVFAEGCRGSLTEEAIAKLGLRTDRPGRERQTYGLGVKEVWRLPTDGSGERSWEKGKVVHTMGWPMNYKTYGGGFEYHMKEKGVVTLGFITATDYANPYISPFQEFQRWKTHSYMASLLNGGQCLAYGARLLNEGGYQSIPKLDFPGGLLVGDCAGFVNVPKIKGTHNAMKSGILAAEAIASALSSSSSDDKPIDLSHYSDAMSKSSVFKELYEVRNVRPSFHTSLGMYGGVLYSGIDTLLLKGRVPFTFHHPKETDAQMTGSKDEYEKIEYPRPDGKLTFSLMESVARTGTDHEEDQPSHLVLNRSKTASSEAGIESMESARRRHVQENMTKFDGSLARACPAGVYEYLDAEEGSSDADALGKRFVINAQNCIHCKTCSVKTPTEDITWTVPEGGGGPKYSIT